MTQIKRSLQDVLDGLVAEALVPESNRQQGDHLLSAMHEIQPWYIRTLVGFGAWLASLLLIGFVAGFSMVAEGGYLVVGVIMMIAAVAVRRKVTTDFMVQSSLAVSLAGQALFAFGVADIGNHDEFEMVLVVAIIMSAILFVVFPDRIHRVISVLIAASSLATLMYAWEWNAALPFLGPVFAALLVYLHQRQSGFAAGGKGAMIRPLMNGLMLSAFGCLMLSTIYVLPELVDDFVFYPRPWISTLMLGGLFLYLGSQVWPAMLGKDRASALSTIYVLQLVLIAAAWVAPGLLLALNVILMGAASGSRLQVGAGIGFLAVFLTAYFYGIDISMMEKSATLIASGVAILVARWLLLRVMQQPAQGGSGNE